MKYFHAHSIECSEDNHLLSIRIADDEFDPIDFILISYDRSANTLDLIVNEDDFEFKNVITTIILKYDELTIGLNPTCAERLEYEQIVIESNLDLSELKDYLRQITTALNIQSKIV